MRSRSLMLRGYTDDMRCACLSPSFAAIDYTCIQLAIKGRPGGVNWERSPITADLVGISYEDCRRV